MFSCEFCKTSHNTFFIEPFGRLLLRNHSFCLLPHHGLSSFQKWRHTYFPAEYLLSLICKQGTTEVKLAMNKKKTLVLDSQFLKRIGWSFNLKPWETSPSKWFNLAYIFQKSFSNVSMHTPLCLFCINLDWDFKLVS